MSTSNDPDPTTATTTDEAEDEAHPDPNEIVTVTRTLVYTGTRRWIENTLNRERGLPDGRNFMGMLIDHDPKEIFIETGPMVPRA